MTQDQALDILMMGQNVFLTGAAGTWDRERDHGFDRYRGDAYRWDDDPLVVRDGDPRYSHR